VEEAKADAPERRKDDIPKIRRVPAAMQAEGDGVNSEDRGGRLQADRSSIY
jgi:hypothetical protein